MLCVAALLAAIAATLHEAPSPQPTQDSSCSGAQMPTHGGPPERSAGAVIVAANPISLGGTHDLKGHSIGPVDSDANEDEAHGEHRSGEYKPDEQPRPRRVICLNIPRESDVLQYCFVGVESSLMASGVVEFVDGAACAPISRDEAHYCYAVCNGSFAKWLTPSNPKAQDWNVGTRLTLVNMFVNGITVILWDGPYALGKFLVRAGQSVEAVVPQGVVKAVVYGPGGETTFEEKFEGLQDIWVLSNTVK